MAPAACGQSRLAKALRAHIAADGPLRLDHWMAACNAHYYASRDPFGVAGDFVTAPEISQMFGELIGGWVADLWLRAGRPLFRLVELGPGRGTLLADALRVANRLPGFGAAAAIDLVEISPGLRAAQAGKIAAKWRDSFDTIPDDRPIILIANEFFDALPIRQFDGTGGELAVASAGDGFAPTLIPALGEPAGERSDAGRSIAAAIGGRLRRHGGAALIIDYGYAGQVATDSLQALRQHRMVDIFSRPGDADLTAHVDFSALASAAGEIRVSGPVAQGVWLARLGIEARAAALQAGASRADAAAVAAALVRLTAPAQMGNLFKVMALSASHWPEMAGFDA